MSDVDLRLLLLLDDAMDYLESGVGGTSDFSDEGLERGRRRYSDLAGPCTLDDLKAAVRWLEYSYLIMATGPNQYKLSPDGIAYIKNPRSRDPRLPPITQEFGERLTRGIAKGMAWSKELTQELAPQDAENGAATDLPIPGRFPQGD